MTGTAFAGPASTNKPGIKLNRGTSFLPYNMGKVPPSAAPTLVVP